MQINKGFILIGIVLLTFLLTILNSGTEAINIVKQQGAVVVSKVKVATKPRLQRTIDIGLAKWDEILDRAEQKRNDK